MLFINGDRDEYTTAEDARQFGNHVGKSHFTVIRDAGHFLDMENKTACEATRSALLGFLKPTVRQARARTPYNASQEQHAWAI
ncbi:Rhamnosyltransferase 1 subunit A [compost metagenome]